MPRKSSPVRPRSILTEEPPEAPAGFENSEQALLAVGLGAVARIDAEAPLPENVKLTKDIDYGLVDGRALKLDLYQPVDAEGPAAGLVFIHGGAWKKGSKDNYRYYAQMFAAKGYVVVSVGYRLLGEKKYPAAIEDCKCAVRWMRANAEALGVDPQRIAAIGGSAGGHLSMMVGYSSDVPKFEGAGGHAEVSSAVQCVVNLYGPTDLTTDFVRENEYAGQATREFLGKSLDEDEALFEEASPITHVDADDPPTLILHGTVDDIVPINQADILAAKLTEVGVPYLYDRLPGWPHSMDVAKPVNERCVWLMGAVSCRISETGRVAAGVRRGPFGVDQVIPPVRLPRPAARRRSSPGTLRTTRTTASTSIRRPRPLGRRGGCSPWD